MNYSDNIFNNYDWSHAFIREAYLVSPSYITENNHIAPDYKPTIKIIFNLPSAKYKILEFIFFNVEKFSVDFTQEIEPKIVTHNNKISLYSDNFEIIKCSKYKFQILDESYLGYNLKYGWENIFDEGGCIISE